MTLPGFVNAHSHAFQRVLRGRAAGADFWEWRSGMLTEAERQTPESVRSLYEHTYREMRAAGITAVGEFHYLGLETAWAAAEAAKAAGLAFVCLHVAYARGGTERMRQPSVTAYLKEVERLREDGVAVGLAPHSVRACPREWLVEIARFAEAEHLVLHVHAGEQPRRQCRNITLRDGDYDQIRTSRGILRLDRDSTSFRHQGRKSAGVSGIGHVNLVS